MMSSGTITQKLSGFEMVAVRYLVMRNDVRGISGTPQFCRSIISTKPTIIGKATNRNSPPGLFAIIQNDDEAIESVWRRCVAKPNDWRADGTEIAIRVRAVSGVRLAPAKRPGLSERSRSNGPALSERSESNGSKATRCANRKRRYTNASTATEMPTQSSRFPSIGPSSVNMRTFFSTIVQFDIISFMMAKTPIGSVSSAISGFAIRETYRKNVTGYDRKNSPMVPT